MYYQLGLDVYYCIKNHCLKNHVFDNPPIYESGIICSPYMSAQLEFEVLTPDVFSPWTVVLRKKSKPFTLGLLRTICTLKRLDHLLKML